MYNDTFLCPRKARKMSENEETTITQAFLVIAIVAAVTWGLMWVIGYFFTEGADPERINKYEYQAVTFTEEATEIKNCILDVACTNKYIKDEKRKANAKDKNNRTPLHLAAIEGDAKKIRTLITAGAKIEAKSNDYTGGQTALHEAAYHGHTAVIRALLDAGADINAKTMDGRQQTPLQIAIRKSQTEAIRTLLDAGANLNAKDNSGNTPLHFAAFYHAETVRTLLDAGANLNAKDNSGFTPLHNAAISGNVSAIRTLLDAGANVNAKDGINSTPLHVAYQNKHASAIRTLIEAGANTEIRDWAGRTPRER